MTDPHQLEYLQIVLSLDPHTEAEVILQRRREFLQPDGVILAESATSEGEGSNLRTRLLQQLSQLRRDFWLYSDGELEQRLSALRHVDHAETIAEVTRLRQVAALRPMLRGLCREVGVDAVFLRALVEILLAPASQASVLRERALSWLRPEGNSHFEVAREEMQRTALVLRDRFPKVFQMEEAWLSEVIAYDPTAETPNDNGDAALGCLGVLLLVLVLLMAYRVVVWIFS